MMRNFVEIETMIVRNKMTKKKLALVGAEDDSALKSVIELSERGYIHPILIGDETVIKEKLKDYQFEIVHASTPARGAEIAVKLAREKKIDMIMKGFIQTSDLLRPVVNSETGIRKKSVLSHVAVYESTHMPNLFIVSDGGMMITPTLEQKVGIIENAVYVAHSLGQKEPKVALLDAAEHTNKHIPASFESEELTQKNKDGFMSDCIIEGPISLDIAINSKVAKTKKYPGKICGDADILIVPDIVSGNILGKAITEFSDSKMAGLIMGAEVPIILTSRGAGSEERINSMLLACFASLER